MPQVKQNHVHRLKRHRYKNGTPVFFCTLDNCNFKIGVEFSLGKSNICWRCGQPFEMNNYSIRLAKPHCPSCHKGRGMEEYVNKRQSRLQVSNESVQLPEGDRRKLPTRRELDPTVLSINAEESIESLKAALGTDQVEDLQPITYQQIEVDDEDVEL